MNHRRRRNVVPYSMCYINGYSAIERLTAARTFMRARLNHVADPFVVLIDAVFVYIRTVTTEDVYFLFLKVLQTIKYKYYFPVPMI